VDGRSFFNSFQSFLSIFSARSAFLSDGTSNIYILKSLALCEGLKKTIMKKAFICFDPVACRVLPEVHLLRRFSIMDMAQINLMGPAWGVVHGGSRSAGRQHD